MKNFDKIPAEYKKEEFRLDEEGKVDIFRIPGTNLVYKEIALPALEKYFIELEKLKSDVFVFPQELVYVKNVFMGYLMEFIQGVMIKNIDPNILIPELFAMFREVEKGIIDLTKQSVKIVDINVKNIIITPEKKMRVVDTDLFEVTSEDPYMIRLDNFTDYNDTIMDIVAKEIIRKFGSFMDRYIQEIYEACVYSEVSASYCLEKMKEYLQNRFGEELNTLDELKNALSLAAKR